MNGRDDELQLAIYSPPPSFTGGCLEIRLFYVRIAPCAVDGLPDQLRLRHLRRELGVQLEINGERIPPSDAVCINLRRDRVDKDSSEVTYVSTDSVRVSGPMEFEVCEEGDGGDLVLCGSLERADVGASWGDDNGPGNDSRTGWSLECYVATSVANGRSALLHPKKGACSPTIEVYIAGCCSGAPVILMKTVLVSPRRKVRPGVTLDAIPEDEEIGKEQMNLCNGVVRQRKLQLMPTDMDEYESDGKVAYGNYSEEMYPGEDGQLTWFNAGVRVGVGIGLGMCLGVGIGVGLLMRSYQATTRSFRRRFF
ncbi:erythronate-4-phosphate dehydrogenase family protein [Striga asiatica]|uniref:Erythronate-4-phosphate dehydrogenase family protein n=1 Tax=Striga asiatica TaxID=4170 RepID=A0A5A7P143_STRAF|nr:erythronate-4-phosphate dehydrogenase family protein [Striga asiatica]